MKVIDNVYVVSGVTANSYILVEPDPYGLTVIDTGLPYSEKTILRYIASKGWSARDIKRILITHADLDHYGCLAALQKESGARTYASRVEAKAIAEGQSSRPLDRNGNNTLQRLLIAFFSRILKATPFQVDEILSEGQTLPVLGGLQVVETPGHSPNHISFFASSVGVLFCGDSMKSDDKGLRVSRSRNNWDQDRAEASVRKQARLGAQIVCPGHGPVVRDAGNKFPT
ncbi:MAG TPA: MBL fold metallo-hydrolase [Anaerolineales bacterium]|nr:MBL fold metallo-hydrolase [Anaerolineales bacterium]